MKGPKLGHSVNAWLAGAPGGNLMFPKCVVRSTVFKLHQYLIYKEQRVVQCAHKPTYMCDCQSLSVLTTFSSISTGKAQNITKVVICVSEEENKWS